MIRLRSKISASQVTSCASFLCMLILRQQVYRECGHGAYDSTLRRAKHLRWQPLRITAAARQIYLIAPMSHRHNIYASFDFEIASATTKWAAAVAEGGLDVVDVHRLLAHFQARGSLRFGTACGLGPPSAVGRQGRVGRRR